MAGTMAEKWRKNGGKMARSVRLTGGVQMCYPDIVQNWT